MKSLRKRFSGILHLRSKSVWVIPTFCLLLFILSPFVEIYVVQIIFPFHVIDWKRTFARVKQIMASLLCCYVTTLTTGISGEFGTSVVNLWYIRFGPTQKTKTTKNKQTKQKKTKTKNKKKNKKKNAVEGILK